MKRLVLLFALFCLAAVPARAQMSEQLPAGNAANAPAHYGKPTPPLDVTLTHTDASPLAGGEVVVTLDVTAQADVYEAVVRFSAEGNVQAGNAAPQRLGTLRAGETRRVQGTARLTGTGRGILHGIAGAAAGPGEAALTFGRSASLYFLVAPGRTFVAPGSFYRARLDSLNDASGGAKQGEAAYEQALRELRTVQVTPVIKTGATAAGKHAGINVSGKILWTDRNGGTHPARFVTVVVWDKDEELLDFIDDKLGTTQTGATGDYSIDVESDDSDGADLYLEVFAGNTLADVLPPGKRGTDNAYIASTEDQVFENATAASVRVNYVIPNTTESGNAFGILDSIVEAALYAKQLTGSPLPKVPVEFPCTANDAACFSKGGVSLVYDRPDINMEVILSDRYDWDVLHHEYGHFLSKYHSVDDNPGGGHALGDALSQRYGSKSIGTRLAWSEGWPSYFGISLQREMGSAALGIPDVGDNVYQDREISGDLIISLESPATSFQGEDDEVAVMAILWDLYDSENDKEDKISLGAATIWDAMKRNGTDNLSGFWNALIRGRNSIKEQTDLGSIFAHWGVAPDATSLIDGEAVSTDGGGLYAVHMDGGIRAFSWKPNGGKIVFKNSQYYVEFWDENLTTRYHTSPMLSSPSYMITELDWFTYTSIVPSRNFKWVVKAKNPIGPETGEYVSPAFLVDPGVDFAAVVDVSGDMSSVLPSIVGQLQANLSVMPDTNSVGYQLTSFVGNTGSVEQDVNQRHVINDKNAFSAQIASLRSGGGECKRSAAVGIGGLVMQTQEMDQGGSLFYASNKTFVVPRESPLYGGVELVKIILASLQGRGVQFNFMYNNAKDCFSNHAKAGQQDDRQTLEAYVSLAQATGGTFAYVPVDENDPASVARYEHTLSNMIQGSLRPAIMLVDAPAAPPGAALTVTLNGGKTGFRTGTTLDFGAGITVTEVQALSPTRLQARLEVAPGAAHGFRDVTARTPIGNTEETATGVGAFEVTAAPAEPTVLSVTPKEGGLGQMLTVTVDGFGTTFDETSALDFGPGITVQSVTALSNTRLQAVLQIDAGAPTGFRDVTVTTGGELAAEDRPGPFFVLESVLALPAITAVSPAEAEAGTMLDVTLTAVNTTLINFATTADFGPGITVLSTSVLNPSTVRATLQIDAAAVPGLRDVRVTTILETAVLPGGFSVTAPSSVATDDPDTLPGEFVLAQNYPNPFNPSTTIRFGLKRAGHARLTVYDPLGRAVAVLLDAPLAGGNYTADFDAGDLPSGSYFYRLSVDGAPVQSRVMLLVR